MDIDTWENDYPISWAKHKEFKEKVATMERKYKKPNCRYVTLTTGEIVLLEVELADGSFICTPEYFKYMEWPYKNEATKEDVWERPPRIKNGGSTFQFNPDDALSMLDPMNVDNYRNGKW